jgi:hypothetical protein
MTDAVWYSQHPQYDLAVMNPCRGEAGAFGG